MADGEKTESFSCLVYIFYLFELLEELVSGYMFQTFDVRVCCVLVVILLVSLRYNE